MGKRSVVGSVAGSVAWWLLGGVGGGVGDGGGRRRVRQQQEGTTQGIGPHQWDVGRQFTSMSRVLALRCSSFTGLLVELTPEVPNWPQHRHLTRHSAHTIGQRKLDHRM